MLRSLDSLRNDQNKTIKKINKKEKNNARSRKELRKNYKKKSTWSKRDVTAFTEIIWEYKNDHKGRTIKNVLT